MLKHTISGSLCLSPESPLKTPLIHLYHTSSQSPLIRNLRPVLNKFISLRMRNYWLGTYRTHPAQQIRCKIRIFIKRKFHQHIATLIERHNLPIHKQIRQIIRRKSLHSRIQPKRNLLPCQRLYTILEHLDISIAKIIIKKSRQITVRRRHHSLHTTVYRHSRHLKSIVYILRPVIYTW